ncbi:MAG: hypothetical protein IM651_13285, partial [Phenylobacterium sp.]|nr:hypothetical protein [Phenylobacterium sp.]
MSGNLYSLLARGFSADPTRHAFRPPGSSAVSYGELEILTARAAAGL